MFGFLNDIGKAVLGAVTLPLAMIEDAGDVTGATEGSGNNTKQRLADILKNIENAVKPE